MELNRKPLYRQVADLLREEIETTMAEGEQLESEEKLAKRLSVSMVTIREALWILAGEGIILRQQGRGTFVGARRRDRQVAILMERDISHPRHSHFFLRVTQSVREVLEQKGHRVQLYIGRLQPNELSETLTCRNFLEDMEADRIAGVAAVFALPHSSWTAPLEQRGVPIVGLGIRHRYMIDTDYEGMVESGLRCLVEEGRSRIACLGWNRGPADPGGEENGGKPYERALEKAFAKLGVASRPGWLRHDLHPAQTGAGWEEFREVWEAYDEKPDGLFIMDEFLFRDASTAILDLGIRVPEDLTVVTQANVGSEILCPFPVVGLVVDPDRVALQLGEMLHALLRGRAPIEKRAGYPYEIKYLERAECIDAALGRNC